MTIQVMSIVQSIKMFAFTYLIISNESFFTIRGRRERRTAATFLHSYFKDWVRLLSIF